MVKQNILATSAHGIVIEGKGAAERVAVDNNEVLRRRDRRRGSRLRRRDPRRAARRRPRSSATPSPASGRASTDGDLRAGSSSRAAEDVRVAGNVVDEIGPQDGVARLRGRDRRDRAVRARVGLGQLRPLRPERPAPTRRALVRAADPVGRRRQVRVGGAGRPSCRSRSGAVVVSHGWAFAAAARARPRRRRLEHAHGRRRASRPASCAIARRRRRGGKPVLARRGREPVGDGAARLVDHRVVEPPPRRQGDAGPPDRGEPLRRGRQPRPRRHAPRQPRRRAAGPWQPLNPTVS